MIDRSSLNHPSLSGTDYVLEGASIRDRFLTAFILQHNGSLETTWPHAARMPDRPASYGLGAQLPGADEETFKVHIESTCEPLTVRVIDDWFGADDDEDDL
jgi:hypothetical protein